VAPDTLGSFAGVRHARIKISPTEGEAIYHCISRTVNGELLFDDAAKEVLRRQLWQVADYCGVKILTYTVMSNHVHVLLHVPKQEPVLDAELLRRYRVLHTRPTVQQAAQLARVEAELIANGPAAVEWRRRQLALMGDLSQFMKLLKQRFSIWFNKAHRRFGTLWAERFKSVLVSTEPVVRRTIAAYIDLNCVRAGLVSDPKDYRFCGYADAVAGVPAAREGICAAVGENSWDECQAYYRTVLFGTGASPREAAAAISQEDLERVIKDGGRLSPVTVLRCRLRYFADGAVLGGRAFVERQLAIYRAKTGRRQRSAPHVLPDWMGFVDWAALRGVRRTGFG
jgi:REP element-mobilizing transposase RayT